MHAPIQKDTFRLFQLTINHVSKVATCTYIAQTNNSHIRKIKLIFSKNFRILKVESNELFKFQLFLIEKKFSQVPYRKEERCYECVFMGIDAERLCEILYNNIIIEDKAPYILENKT